MRKVLMILWCTVMCLSLCACGKGCQATEKQGTSPAFEATPAAEPEATEVSAAAEEPSIVGEPVVGNEPIVVGGADNEAAFDKREEAPVDQSGGDNVVSFSEIYGGTTAGNQSGGSKPAQTAAPVENEPEQPEDEPATESVPGDTSAGDNEAAWSPFV